MRKSLSLILCLLLLVGCSGLDLKPSDNKLYSTTFLDLFDTVTTITGKSTSKQAFETLVQPIYDKLECYHKFFDIYKQYEGINNLKTVNDQAFKAPIKVDPAILDLLQDCKNYYTATNGVFNPAMGSVLKLWHDARKNGINDPETAYLPDINALNNAGQHINPDNIILDRENSTVFISDPELKIDVGAIAKGWAVQNVCKNAPNGLLISVGGNVYATGPKDENGTAWSVGIQNPKGQNNLHVLNVTSGSVVTSGSYQRAYTVDGKSYHHIIDPTTLYPSELWTSVTIVCEDSGLADVLSTSLFLLNREQGQALLNKFGAKALWVDANNNLYYSPDFDGLIKE